MTAVTTVRSPYASQNNCPPRELPDPPDTRFPAYLMRREPNALWNYSLKIYAVPAVADACLSLQERAGADVNLLLFCCWRGSLGHALGKPALRKVMEVVADWQHQVVLPLRQARRFIKAGIPAMPLKRQEQLRQSIAAVELDAEYLEQLLLAHHVAAKSLAVGKDPPATVIAGNLRCYLSLLNNPSEPSIQSHLQVLRAACRSNSPA